MVEEVYIHLYEMFLPYEMHIIVVGYLPFLLGFLFSMIFDSYKSKLNLFFNDISKTAIVLFLIYTGTQLYLVDLFFDAKGRTYVPEVSLLLELLIQIPLSITYVFSHIKILTKNK